MSKNKATKPASTGAKKSAVKHQSDTVIKLTAPVTDDEGNELKELRGVNPLLGYHARKFKHLEPGVELGNALAMERFGVSQGVLDRLAYNDHSAVMLHILELTNPIMGK